ncbi:MAG TPA: hypothetical protein VGZ71_11280 [Puia sp.]|nr:hypothetical protein [Puia sp.]
MKKESYFLAITIISSLLLSFLHCPFLEIFFDDKEIFKYAGLVISKGGIPYRDFFDHKPPLIFFLNWLGQLMGPWGLWLMDSILVLFASFLFLALCRKYKLSYPWMLPVIFNLLLRNFSVSYGIGMTREYTALLLLIFFCVLMGHSKYRYFLLGLLSSCIFFMQQDQVLLLIPFFIYLGFSDFGYFRNRPFTVLGSMCLGFLALAAPLLLYFSLNHTLTYFWEDAFLFNFNWYTEKKPILQHLRVIKDELERSKYDLTFYGSVALGAFSLISGNKKKWLLLVSLIVVFLSFCSEFLSGKMIFGLSVRYYLLPLAASLPILLFTIFSFSDKLFSQNRLHPLIYGTFISVGLLLNILQGVSNSTKSQGDWVKNSSASLYLRRQAIHDYQLYVVNNSNYIYLYNKFRILAPSKWIYHQFWRWYEGWDLDNKKLASITQDLQKHQTTYILDFSDDSSFKNHSNFLYWQYFLQSHYSPVILDSVDKKMVLWKIK